MRFSVSDRMSSQFLHFFLLLPFVWTSENPASSGWAKMQISTDVLCSMPYGDFRLNIYEHIKNHISTTPIGQKRYFYTPITLVDHKSAESKHNNATKLTEMHFRIEMWNDQVQSEVVNYLSDFIGQQIRSNQIQVISFDKMVLTTTKPSIVYSLSTNWLPYQLEKSVWFSFKCFNQKDCNQIQHVMHENPTEFRHLKLLFSQSSQTSLTKEMAINFDNIVSSSTMVSDLLKRCENSEFALLSSEDEKRLLSEIKTNVILESFDDSEIISPSSESQVYNALKVVLLSRVETKRIKEKINESVCWDGRTKEVDLEVPGKIEEVTENDDGWSEINENTKTGVDYAIPTDVPVDAISSTVKDYSNSESQDSVEGNDKRLVSKSISLSRINLEKLRNSQSIDNRPVTVRYSKAVLSTFVHFFQFAKLSTTDEWAELKNELKVFYQNHDILNTEYQKLKTECQNLKRDHSNLSVDYQSLKADHGNLKRNYRLDLDNTNIKLSVFDRNHINLNTDHQKLKNEYQNLKKDHDKLSADYQNLKIDHNQVTRNYELDLSSTNKKLSDFQPCGEPLVVGNEIIIDSDLYNESCTWQIQTQSNRILAFSLVDGDIKHAGKFLTIYDGHGANSPNILTKSQYFHPKSREDLPTTMYTTNSIAEITFKKMPNFRLQLKIQKAVKCPANLGSNTECGRILDHVSCYCAAFEINTQPFYTRFCKEHNMLLISLENQDEDQAVRLAWGKDVKFWTCGSDSSREGLWVWESTNKRVGYTNWHHGEPSDSGGNEDCLQMGYHKTVGWNDWGCSGKSGAVCEAQP